MRPMIKKLFGVMLLGIVLSGTTVHAGMREWINEAVGILSTKQNSNTPIPREILAKARAVAIIEITRGGIGIGGSHGDGILLARTQKGWSAPLAFGQGGGSVGAQLGFESKKYIYVLMSDAALEQFTGDEKFKFDAKATATAGPDHVTEEAIPQGELFVYTTKSDGAFAGATIGGQVVSVNYEVNRKAYGQGVTTAEILSGKVTAPKGTDKLHQLLKSSK